MSNPTTRALALRLFAIALFYLTAAPLFAGDETAAKPPEVVPSVAVQPPIWSHFAVHGYLTQAYADANQHQVLGITRDGTAQYRAAALQLSYTPSDKDRMVVQLSHERSGKTFFQEDNVELDWGFYEHRFGNGTAVKIGRVQLPFGIYNELRDVGTVLPFYRIPINYYGEGTFTNEALDGASVSHTFAPQSRWSVSATGYYGRWTMNQVMGPVKAEADVKRAFGTQLWLNTPIDGLRLGGSAQRVAMYGGLDGMTGQLEKTYAVSVDGTFDRVTARGEASTVRWMAGHTEGWYAEVGVRVLPKVSVNAMTDHRHLLVHGNGPHVDTDLGVDNAFGVNFYANPNFVLKVEAHRNRSLSIEDGPVNPFAPPPRADYVIGSVSLSF